MSLVAAVTTTVLANWKPWEGKPLLPTSGQAAAVPHVPQAKGPDRPHDHTHGESGSDSPLLGCRVKEEAGQTVKVVRVPPGSLAAQLGLEPGDLIETVSHDKIDSIQELEIRLARLNRLVPGAVTVFRGGQKLFGDLRMGSDERLTVLKPLRTKDGAVPAAAAGNRVAGFRD
jgi:S1-C subfamily serine protease